MKHRTHRFALASAALLTALAGCHSPATAVVITLDTNIPTARPMELTVRTMLDDLSTNPALQQWSRGVSARPETLVFPSSFTVVPGTGDRAGSAMVALDVNALPWVGGADTLRFTRRVRFAFTPGRTTRVRVYLAAECGSQATECPPSNPRCTIADQCEARGLSCGEGGRCESVVNPTIDFDIDAQFSVPDSGASGMDASSDGATDAATDASADRSAPDASDSGDASATDVAVIPEACVPMCSGRTCGPDGCGGECGSCAPRANMVPSCNGSGQCAYTCAAGFGDCDSNPANGCEVALNTTSNCGACGRACSGGSPVCDTAMGMCSSGCSSGQTRCGMSCVDTTTDVANCGTCGRTCSLTNATARCNASNCAINACNAGFGNCDGNAANGCETPLNSAANCGACGRACSGATPVCDSAMGVCVSGCGAGETLCGMTCANTSNNASHCGGCGNACPARANASVSCSGSSCRFTCNAGFGDCDGNAANGCEAPLNTTSNCGTCGRSCSYANGSASCNAGSCALAGCTTGFGNCDGNASNGCESPLNSLSHCGGCGVGCSVSNGSATCASGSCQVASCSAGFGNCDGNAGNGCETGTSTNASHCGACGNACPGRANASSYCSGSACGFTCSGGFGDCDGNGANGCETNTTNSVSHCGGCGNACPARANASISCSGSSCQFACAGGFGNCDGNAANGCEAPLNSLANCGGCGVGCSRANATATCGSGSCDIGSCNAGWGNCDGNSANGCETNLNINGNCGGCGVTCSAGQSCIGGFCQCAGYSGCGGSNRCCETEESNCSCRICVCSTCACP